MQMNLKHYNQTKYLPKIKISLLVLVKLDIHPSKKKKKKQWLVDK